MRALLKSLSLLSMMLIFMSNNCERTDQHGGFATPNRDFRYPEHSQLKNDDVFVLCKRSQPCDDGTYRDAFVSKKVCRQLLNMQKVTQCKLQVGQKIDPNRDFGCSCDDVCPMNKFYNKKMNIFDSPEENVTLDDLYDELEAPKDREGKYKLNMGLTDINHKLSTYLKFEKDKELPDFKNSDEKTKFYKDAIKSALAGEVTSLPGYENLNQAINDSPEFKAMFRDELEAYSSAGTGELNKRWQQVVAKDKNKDIDPLLNLRRVDESLSEDNSGSYRKVSFRTPKDDMVVGTIVPFGEDEPYKQRKSAFGDMERVYCLMGTRKSESSLESSQESNDKGSQKCTNQIVKSSRGIHLMPGNRPIDNFYLDDRSSDEQMAYDKALVQQCYEYTGCRGQEDRMLDLSPEDPALSPSNMAFSQDAGVKNGEPMVKWNECSSSTGVTGSYVGAGGRSRCGQRPMSKEFSDFLNQNLQKCVNLALAQIGKKPSVTLHIDHKGILADTRHNSKSNHSVGRAIDISGFEVTMEDGTKKLLKYSKSSQKGSLESQFFPQFRSCWSKKMEQAKSNCPGRDPKGSIGHEDHRHTHHLHISLPYCPRKGGYYVK